MTYGQYEGFDRNILQLDDESIRLRKLLAINASLLRRTCIGTSLYERLEAPEYGDLVYEDTALISTDMERIAKGIGFFVAHRAEPELLDIEGGIPEFVETKAIYIQYGPEEVDVCRWTNARVHVIPTAMSFMDF
jgi:hypothetical protein